MSSDWSFAAESFGNLMREADAARKKMTPYEAGHDCGLMGPDQFNCHFGFFATPEQTREWERGKTDGERSKRALTPND